MSQEPELSVEPAVSKPAPQLLGFQRQYLKGLAHDLKPVVLVGQGGVTEAVVRAVSQALLDHELIKVRLTKPEDKRGFSEALAAGAGAVLCGLVGHTAILYRPHPDKPRIRLPQRASQSADPVGEP